MCTFDAMEMMT